ncbi:MAG: hypothetical protein KF881_00830 [Acidobacteria bacterium]|nr:hypothetical protein [Acidobacteriota bacterium]
MPLTKDSAVETARKDCAKRCSVAEKDVETVSVKDRDFPNSALGSPTAGEMAAQMISSGWEIKLRAGRKTLEYRADKYQVRLHNFGGKNYVIYK